ncbi:MAG: cytochrome c3 family protein [Desulfobacter sp.]|nr:MAG: cytochrome c3 family protein [Desulfobacter sp.]
MRPDILVIDIPPVENPDDADVKDMPPVFFKHDLHSRALEGQCSKCHEAKEGKIVFKFKRTSTLSGKAYMDLYHENCVACHAEMKGESGKQGPLEAQCRTCHTADPGAASSRVKIKFDRSLHYTHETAKAVKPADKDQRANCSACHHSANMKAKTTFYEKGKESACVYCHKETADDQMPENGVRPARQAAHDSCVVCHLSMAGDAEKGGPVECAGCHDAENQKKIKQHTAMPRLDRNQPDQALMTGFKDLGQDEAANKKMVAAHMDAVPFNHKLHEEKGISCKTCHHDTLNECASCHTAKGDAQGGYIKLADAMHNSGSAQSCIGCHNEIKTAKECAGCHAQMPEKDFKDQDCAACHSVDVKSTPAETLNDTHAKARLAKDALAAKTYTKVNLEDIPETVEIKTIAEEYKPSSFPHRAVVEAIFKQVGDNAMGKSFHKSDLTMCAGCHHNSPATMTPPQCASCHSKEPDIATGKPGLKGAYHGQCITCHQKMEVKSVLPTDCTKCHEKK